MNDEQILSLAKDYTPKQIDQLVEKLRKVSSDFVDRQLTEKLTKELQYVIGFTSCNVKYQYDEEGEETSAREKSNTTIMFGITRLK